MTTIRPAYLLLSVALAMAGGGTAQSHAHAHAITFRDIEFDYPKDERVAVARQQFGAELPIGTPIPTAETVLLHADAHCPAPRVANSLVCTFTMQDAPYNHLHDIVWTIRVTEASDKLNALAIDRQSYGS
jgi:hypothetical protein